MPANASPVPALRPSRDESRCEPVPAVPGTCQHEPRTASRPPPRQLPNRPANRPANEPPATTRDHSQSEPRRPVAARREKPLKGFSYGGEWSASTSATRTTRRPPPRPVTPTHLRDATPPRDAPRDRHPNRTTGRTNQETNRARVASGPGRGITPANLSKLAMPARARGERGRSKGQNEGFMALPRERMVMECAVVARGCGGFAARHGPGGAKECGIAPRRKSLPRPPRVCVAPVTMAQSLLFVDT